MSCTNYGMLSDKVSGINFHLEKDVETGKIGYRLSNTKCISWYWSSEEKFLNWINGRELWSFSPEEPFEGNV